MSETEECTLAFCDLINKYPTTARMVFSRYLHQSEQSSQALAEHARMSALDKSILRTIIEQETTPDRVAAALKDISDRDPARDDKANYAIIEKTKYLGARVILRIEHLKEYLDTQMSQIRMIPNSS